MALPTTPPESCRLSDPTNPYAGRGVVGLGLTGLILYLDKDRVVKVAKTYPVDHLTEDLRTSTEYTNDENREYLVNEKSVYERLGNHKGIIHCFKITEYGIELAYAKQGNLEDYIETTPEPPESCKIEWILSLTDTFSYIHSQKVLVDEIALRNILVSEGQLKVTDFGHSYLLPLTADMDTICENNLTAKIEMLHLGWIIYAIAIWRVRKYYFWAWKDPPGDHRWPTAEELPPADHLFCGSIIKRCWNGGYVSMNALNEDARALLAKYDSRV
ncbi:hypothetical protein MMC30_003869 [Trapelia coarctata]|nr:hypothetical protein [Trapelia coarctata]